MNLFLFRITSFAVFVSSFIFIFLQAGHWGATLSLLIPRLLVSFFGACMGVAAWMMIIEVAAALPSKLRSRAIWLRAKCQDLWLGFKGGLFTQNAEDLAENIREHMRNFRAFLWLSMICFLGMLVSHATLQIAADSWYRIPGGLMIVFLAAFIPAFLIFLQSKGCLRQISALSNYMSNQEVTLAIIRAFQEGDRLTRLFWKRIFPHLLQRA